MEWGNHILDTGPHIFHTNDKYLKKFWLDEFGDLLEEGDFGVKTSEETTLKNCGIILCHGKAFQNIQIS